MKRTEKLRISVKRKVWEAMRDHPGIDSGTILGIVGGNRITVLDAIQRLRKAGLCRSASSDKPTRKAWNVYHALGECPTNNTGKMPGSRANIKHSPAKLAEFAKRKHLKEAAAKAKFDRPIVHPVFVPTTELERCWGLPKTMQSDVDQQKDSCVNGAGQCAQNLTEAA